MNQLEELFSELPEALGGHVLLSVLALAVGLVVSLPLGVLISRRPRLSEWILGVAGVLQTIPSLALLALMVPLLGGQIGFWPAFLTLTLYSILPILANTVVGIRGVDPTMLEAADGLGMSRWQRLWRVELPLAGPVILGGIRTATVLVVATATLATPVGQKTLGNYIFQGLNVRDTPMILFGCFFAAALAVAFDQLIRLLEVGYRQRRPALVRGGIAGLLLLIGIGLYEPVAELFQPVPVVVGNADYTEQHILGEMMRDRLRAAGFRIDMRKNMSQSLLLDALCAGSVDCCIDYSGLIWTTKMKRVDVIDPDKTLRGVVEHLKDEHGVECLGVLGFENAYALVMRSDDAKKLAIKKVSDLVPQAQDLRIAGDMFIFGLPEWKSVQSVYGLGKFKEQKPMEPDLMYGALRDKRVDVITAYTTDGRIAAFNFTVLEDDKKALPPYDAVLLLSKKAAGNKRLREALLPLVGAINFQRMHEANTRVDLDRETPKTVARELLDLVARKQPNR